MGRPGARADRQAGPDRHGCQSVALEHRHRRNAAHGHRSRLDLRGTLRHRRHEGTRGGEGYRAALLPGPEGYDLSQQDESDDFSSHRACTYQQYQGEKLCRRYNAYSYYKILNAFDTHDVGYQRGGVAAALQRITAECLVVGISTDIIFTVPEMQALHRMLPRSTYHQIDSRSDTTGFWSSTNN